MSDGCTTRRKTHTKAVQPKTDIMTQPFIDTDVGEEKKKEKKRGKIKKRRKKREEEKMKRWKNDEIMMNIKIKIK